MATYNVISDYDGNDTFQVEAEDYESALQEALNVLGWTVTHNLQTKLNKMKCPNTLTPTFDGDGH
jgi:hypothetical protein